MDIICLKTGIIGIASSISSSGILDTRPLLYSSCSSKAVGDKLTVVTATARLQKPASRFYIGYPLLSLWSGKGKSSRHHEVVVEDAGVGRESEKMNSSKDQNGNWMMKILLGKKIWKEREHGRECRAESHSERDISSVNISSSVQNKEDEQIKQKYNWRVVENDKNGIEFDRNMFSRMLRRVTLEEAKLFAHMSYLGKLAYCISEIKADYLLKCHGLHFITSSLENKKLSEEDDNKGSSEEQMEKQEILNENLKVNEQKCNEYQINAMAAYHIVAAVTSYLQSHTKRLLQFNSSKLKDGRSFPLINETSDEVDTLDSEVVSLMATTDSVTTVVAVKEEVKQAVADDLRSANSPCEWFICDDDLGTRFFVIQGSGTLASWQANLLFEPVKFEGMDVLVHRGIYEAAKGIYEQMLPEVHSHLKSYGKSPMLRFTGHSLGGSLSLLVCLMLLIRGEVPASSLLPVVTFGAPSIMCGGDHLLRALGLPRSHIQAITMHRDIVPRAFSCNYPSHIVELLKAVNGKFRNHPFLNNQKLLYAPMGELLILQPDEKFSPHHHLLPSGCGLYALTCPFSDTGNAEKKLWAAWNLFLNSPHPLEILRDSFAYGSDGTIHMDHHMDSYVKSMRDFICQELNLIRKARKEHCTWFWWSLVGPNGINCHAVSGMMVKSINKGRYNPMVCQVSNKRTESLNSFCWLTASKNVHFLVFLLFPFRFILPVVCSAISIS